MGEKKLRMEKDFLRMEKDFLRMEKDFLRKGERLKVKESQFSQFFLRQKEGLDLMIR